MVIRQAGQDTKFRTTETSIRCSGTTMRTSGGVTALSDTERMEADSLVRQRLSGKQRQVWEQMAPSRKEKCLAEVAAAIREEREAEAFYKSSPARLEERIEGISCATSVSRRAGSGRRLTGEGVTGRKENASGSISAVTTGNHGSIIKTDTAESVGIKSNGMKRARSGTAASIAVTAAATASIERIRNEIRTEQQKEFRKHSILTGVLNKGFREAVPVLFAGRKGAAGGRVILMGLKKTASVIGTVFKPFLVMAGTLLLTVVLILLILFPGSLQNNTATMDGLPSLLSEEMVTAAIDMRDEYGQPASVLLAQIIVESRGRYGNGLSLLAYEYNNLFGIKSFNTGENRIFMWNRAHTDGGWYKVFDSHTECIEYRAQMLTRPRYAQHTAGIDWKTKEGAQAYAQAVKDGGWAEASGYVSSLVEQMDRYDLYRYDTMSMEEAMTSGTAEGGTGDDVVAYACQFIGNRYVWGGESLTNGCDCSGFVMKVYEHFGVSMPHSSYAQRSVGRAVSVEDMRPGDIVCYSGHVGIYAGNGQIVNASNSKPYPRGGIKYNNAGYRTIIAVRRIF